MFWQSPKKSVFIPRPTLGVWVMALLGYLAIYPSVRRNSFVYWVSTHPWWWRKRFQLANTHPIFTIFSEHPLMDYPDWVRKSANLRPVSSLQINRRKLSPFENIHQIFTIFFLNTYGLPQLSSRIRLFVYPRWPYCKIADCMDGCTLKNVNSIKLNICNIL